MTQPFQVLRLAELHNACVQVWGVHVKAVQVEWALLHPDWTVMDVMPLCLTQFPLLRQLVWFAVRRAAVTATAVRVCKRRRPRALVAENR
jgi:hypothetical protein